LQTKKISLRFERKKFSMNKIILVLFLSALILAIDFYLFQPLKLLTAQKKANFRRIIFSLHFGISALVIGSTAIYQLLPPETLNFVAKRWLATLWFVIYAAKIVGLFPLFVDDLRRLIKFLYTKTARIFAAKKTAISAENPTQASEKGITRSEFLAKTSLMMVGAPLVLMSNGILNGAYDYRVRRQRVVIPNLPKAFHGFRLVQISDVHSGSFFDEKAVMRGIEMLNAEKPDIVCFTGDLVNNTADEMRDYAKIFSKIKADKGVFSVTGNHDYGDYVRWDSPEKKAKNFEDLKKAHAEMGWNLLLNEHRYIEATGEKIAFLGVENWGNRGFAKYGNLADACRNAEADTKILLSHDPSHWDAEILPQQKDIDLTLSGHTHGFQFGVEIGNFKWSPVQYVYEQWAGLYEKNGQKLYVNRGFGFLGFPGRIGIMPEITVLELVRS
jgi:predicted MPP superfamily phosphohydrolase